LAASFSPASDFRNNFLRRIQIERSAARAMRIKQMARSSGALFIVVKHGC